MERRDPRTYNTWRIGLEDGRIKPIEALFRWTFVALNGRVMEFKEYSRLVEKTLPDVEWHQPGEKLEVYGYEPVTWTCAADFYEWADNLLGNAFSLGRLLRESIKKSQSERKLP